MNTTQEHLAGVWTFIGNPGDAYDETMVLFANGEGLMDFWNMGAYCERQIFTWRIEGEQMCISGVEHYFKADRLTFELGVHTREDGYTFDLLRVFDLNKPLTSKQFGRVSRFPEEYRVPQ